jgi:hypothetical protein
MGGYVEAQDIRLEEMATFGSNIGGFFDWANVSTYIHNVAIKTAQIEDLAVNTLKIAGNAVAFTLGANFSGANYGDGNWRTIASLSTDLTGGTVSSAIILFISSTIANNSRNPVYGIMRVVSSSGAIYNCTFISGPIGGPSDTITLMVRIPLWYAQTYSLQAATDSNPDIAPTIESHAYSGSMVLFGVKSSV